MPDPTEFCPTLPAPYEALVRDALRATDNAALTDAVWANHAAAEAAAKADAEMVRIQPDQWRRLVELIGMERHANINPWPEIDAIIASVEVGK